ncbi:MAG: hypothetical protein COB85_01480 [Bacteroidetes bacterium]|nr:MAG: hypothetical protein COB85_01480 [Bacteroidota bacterium]
MSLKILILNYEYPPIGGGGGVISKHIAEGLCGLGYETTVITTWIKGELELENELGWPTVVRLKSKRENNYRSNPIEMLSWISAAKKYLSIFLLTNTIDLCFANFALPGGEVALYVKRRFNIPYVLISHGHDIPWVRPLDHLIVYHAITYNRIKKICLNSEINFMQSNLMKSNIDKFLGPEYHNKNVVISNGVDVEKFKPKMKSENQTFNIVFVGRLVTQKDPAILLKAVRQLAMRTLKYELNIYGDGPLRKELQTMCVNYGISDCVKFHGKIEEDEMPEVYENASLLVAPSRSEGMSISILEALATGLYVLTTPVSGNNELIVDGENGELLEIGNDKVFAERIYNFYHSKFKMSFEVDQKVLSDLRMHRNWVSMIDQYDRQIRRTYSKVVADLQVPT